MCGFEGEKEVGLGNIGDISFNKRRDFLAVRPFKDAKISNIERLGKIGRIRR
jgi:hypothetical protein